MRFADQPLQTAEKQKRPQKYMGLAPQPGDEDLLDQLSPQHREILQAEGHYAELAEKLGVAIGTVRSRLHRARAALAKLREERTAQAERQLKH
jgi:DNA-directed RNA polymerase specialized sigma24 family protein